MLFCQLYYLNRYVIHESSRLVFSLRQRLHRCTASKLSILITLLVFFFVILICHKNKKARHTANSYKFIFFFSDSSSRRSRTCRVVWSSRARIHSTAQPSTSTRPNAPTTSTSRSRETAARWTAPMAAPSASATSTAAPCTRRAAESPCTSRWRRRRSRTHSTRSIIRIIRISSNSSRRRRKHRRRSRRPPCRTVPSDPASAKVTCASATPPTRSRARVWPAPPASTCITITTTIIRSTTAPSPRRRTR